MSGKPTICFGQQPCGIFPKRFLIAKIQSAKELQKKIGGTIVFFYHDSDADFRETITVMRDRQTGELDRINFEQENKIQKKYSPLYLKRIPSDWQAVTARRLPRFVDTAFVDTFASIQEKTVADFCLALYRKLGLLDMITVVRSSDSGFRESATSLDDDYFADVLYEGEVVRARVRGGRIFLHRGGQEYLEVPAQAIEKKQISPSREQRFGWMQSVVHCTHYVTGRGEGEYLTTDNFPAVAFIQRADINDADLAWVG